MKVNTNISLDSDLKRKAVNLFKDFGLDLSTAISIFLAQSVEEQSIPFKIRKMPNETTKQALEELEEMKNNPEKYERYDSFSDAIDEK